MSPNTFFDQFAEKRQGEEISNFWQKVWSNPYWKNENIQFFIINHFVV